MESKNVTAKAS